MAEGNSFLTLFLRVLTAHAWLPPTPQQRLELWPRFWAQHVTLLEGTRPLTMLAWVHSCEPGLTEVMGTPLKFTGMSVWPCKLEPQQDSDEFCAFSPHSLWQVLVF